MIGTETAAIDRWIEPAIEPEPACRKCGHELAAHGYQGCIANDGDSFCPCEEMF